MKKFKAHILVVDDDDRIRDLVKQYLNENNYLVTTAINAEDAQKKVDIIKFDLIVSTFFFASSALNAVVTK